MTKIHIYNRQKKLPLPDGCRKLIGAACRAVLQKEGFVGGAEITVTLVDDKQIHALNAEFREIDRSTDVLSFPLGENGVYDQNPENGCFILGDVVISVDHALMQADTYGHGIDREIAYLTVHSVLHLLGYDHVDEAEEKKIMRVKEEQALALLGLEIQ